jgi:hypothetical protein
MYLFFRTVIFFILFAVLPVPSDDEQLVGLGPLTRHYFDSRLSSFFVDFHPLPQHHRALIDAVVLWQSPTTRDAPTGTRGRFGILTGAVVALAP